MSSRQSDGNARSTRVRAQRHGPVETAVFRSGRGASHQSSGRRLRPATVGTGFGGEAQLRLNPGPLSFGVGVQMTKLEHQPGVDQQGEAERSVHRAPLRDRRSSRIVRPYFAGRLAFMSQNTDLQDVGTTFQVKANALAYGVGGGSWPASTVTWDSIWGRR